LPFAQVRAGLRRGDLSILATETRATIPLIVQVIMWSWFDEAMAVGHMHVRLLKSNKKLGRFLEVQYFSLCEDLDLPFRLMVERCAQSRL
jgi:hypothetical protein